jgi:diguanylate cyclase (GGDEF)-like protein
VHPGDVAAPGGAPELAAGLLAGERLFIPDAREHPAVPQELLRASGALSVVIEPVVAGEALLGALVLGWTERCAEPAARETALLRMLAAEAANALERAALIETMRDVARVDPLTGLPNRAAWDERLEAEIARAARTGEPLALLLLDVDGFTAYNRRFGRAGGNALLRALAAAWRAPLRASDVIARIGADEFAIMLPACSPDDAEMIAERINAETVGLATFGAVLTAWDGSANAAFLMARAESALAQARAQR